MNLTFTPNTLNLALYRGDDAVVTLTVTNPDGTPFDLSGDVTAQVRRRPDDVDVIATPKLDLTNAATGIVLVWFSATDTVTLADDGGSHVWDLQVIDGAGLVFSVVAGRVYTTADVTRP